MPYAQPRSCPVRRRCIDDARRGIFFRTAATASTAAASGRHRNAISAALNQLSFAHPRPCALPHRSAGSSMSSLNRQTLVNLQSGGSFFSVNVYLWLRHCSSPVSCPTPEPCVRLQISQSQKSGGLLLKNSGSPITLRPRTQVFKSIASYTSFSKTSECVLYSSSVRSAKDLSSRTHWATSCPTVLYASRNGIPFLVR